LAEPDLAGEAAVLVVALQGARCEPLHPGPDDRVGRQRLCEVDNAQAGARDHVSFPWTSATAPAMPLEWVIERSATVSPRFSAKASVRPERVTEGFGRPTISISRHEKSTPHPSALPTASLPAKRAA